MRGIPASAPRIRCRFPEQYRARRSAPSPGVTVLNVPCVTLRDTTERSETARRIGRALYKARLDFG